MKHTLTTNNTSLCLLFLETIFSFKKLTMKTLKISLFILAFGLMTINLSAQNWGSKNDSPLQKETRTVAEFHAISVGGGIDLHLRQGKGQNVTVKASEHVIGRVITVVKDGQLHLGMEKGNYRNARMEVYVTIDKLDALKASGGSDVYCKSTFKANDFELHASGGSDVEMALEVEELECHLSGGSDVDLEGMTGGLHIHASGSSDFEGYGLKAKDVVIKASGSSDSNVFASESIEVHASGSSDVNYKGNPSKTNVKSSGSSDVHSH